jgi:hypothetical protein
VKRGRRKRVGSKKRKEEYFIPKSSSTFSTLAEMKSITMKTMPFMKRTSCASMVHKKL